ncbi:MAG: hypothetical protein IKO06_04840, partial [Alphaproteobacteria bacterium]|nr:hypothetical protein [Alphaproteobacteria bacterium]
KGSETTINDAILETKLTKNAAGEITGITTDAKNVSSKYMINDDKTINKNAYDQLMNNAENKEFAARHIISTVMADRGMQLDNQFISSQTKINDDGSWTIVQKNEDGKEQTVTAVFDENTHKMNITSETKNRDGSSTITTSDGTNKKTETRPSGA